MQIHAPVAWFHLKRLSRIVHARSVIFGELVFDVSLLERVLSPCSQLNRTKKKGGTRNVQVVSCPRGANFWHLISCWNFCQDVRYLAVLEGLQISPHRKKIQSGVCIVS